MLEKVEEFEKSLKIIKPELASEEFFNYIRSDFLQESGLNLKL